MRVWKLLLNGENELRSNFDAKKIMDMIIVNVCFASRLPSLSDIIKQENTPEEKIEEVKQEENLINDITNMFSDAKVLN